MSKEYEVLMAETKKLSATFKLSAKQIEELRERILKMAKTPTPVYTGTLAEKTYTQRIAALQPGDILHWDYATVDCAKYVYLGSGMYMKMTDRPTVANPIASAIKNWHLEQDCPR